jgi:hemerythrin-like domain-containing protein
MKPIGPLMREHRLIERMVELLRKELGTVSHEKKANAEFLLAAIDFMRVYSDMNHYDKEDEILFKKLAEKSLSREHRRIMNELTQEHVVARDIVKRLAEARLGFLSGRRDAIDDIQELVSFYPMHIEKEDKHFFYPCLDYLSRQEQDIMLEDMWEFDRKLIHEKYENVIKGLEE